MDQHNNEVVKTKVHIRCSKTKESMEQRGIACAHPPKPVRRGKPRIKKDVERHERENKCKHRQSKSPIERETLDKIKTGVQMNERKSKGKKVGELR